MPTPSQAVYRAADIRAIETRAADEHGLASAELMDRAGRAAFESLRGRWPDARRIVVVTGSGNNGGDGRVVARLAAADGLSVEVVDPVSAHRSGFAAPDSALSTQHSALDRKVDVIVDALFGIGLNRAPDGAAAALIDAINAHPAPVLALDIPSGLDADDGSTPGVAVDADVTVTFLAYKRGLFTGQGPRRCGDIVVADLGVPAAAYDGVAPVAAVIGAGSAARMLGRRPRDAHKGQYGYVLVVGGRAGMSGAARLAAEAALRCGAGLVSVAAAPGTAVAIGAGRPELMVHECSDADALAPLIERATVIALGPGLGTDAWGRALMDAALRSDRPVVIDADALNLLAASPTRRADWILTPHPGEASRLLGMPVATIQADRYAAVDALVERTGGVVVLKGACTLVGARGVTPSVSVAGNPGMASGGIGDVLTGVIAALRAQGLDAVQAARAGVQLHAEAGDEVAHAFGQTGLIASDLMTALQSRVNDR